MAHISWRPALAAAGALAAVLAAGSGAAAQAVTSTTGTSTAGTSTASSTGWHRVYRSWSTHSNQLESVAAISARNAWAVGSNHTAALVLHWNGTHWRTVTLPGAAGFFPTEVRATSASNVWIWGTLKNGESAIDRWDGSSWQTIPLPGTGVAVIDLTVLSSSDAWLVGPTSCTITAGNPPKCSVSLYRWNGSSWSAPYQLDRYVNAISGSSPGNVWLLAEGSPSTSLSKYSLIAYRWNGTTWARVTSMPHPRTGGWPAINVTSARNVWIGAFPEKGRRFNALHWNGHGWRQLVAPATIAASPQPVPDGRGGVWMGPWAHWNGHRWLDTVTGPLLTSGNAISLHGLARIPGRATIWGAGSMSRTPSSKTWDSLIAAFGPVP